jgi:hypothetical protein
MEEVVKSRKTGKGMIHLYRNGIMHQTYNKGVHLSGQDSEKELKVYMEEFCADTRRPILVELNEIKSVSKESRRIYSSEKTAKYLSAAALLVGSPVSRIIGNFYQGINKTYMPVKLFTRTKEAVAWLKTFLAE